MQGLSRNPYLYSMELAVYGQVCLALTMAAKALYYHLSPDHDPAALALDASALSGWTRLTWVPILTQALGGVIVGLVTKHAGGVKKGFALIAGIALTAFVQAVWQVSEREIQGGGCGCWVWVSWVSWVGWVGLTKPSHQNTHQSFKTNSNSNSQSGHAAPAAALAGRRPRRPLHLHALGLRPGPRQEEGMIGC